MASSGATSEIVEEFPQGHHSNGSSRLKFMLKADQKDGKSHVYPVDELERIIKEIHRRGLSRNSGYHQKDVSVSRNNPSKKPVSEITSQISGAAPSDGSISLKQALRKLCISQASEMAAFKRLSKPIGTSGVAEASAIKRLYASLVDQANDSGIPQNHGKGVLVEASLVPERGTMNSSKKEAQIHLRKDKVSSIRNVASSSETAMSRSQGVNTSAPKKEDHDSSNAQGKDSKRKVNSKAYTSIPSSSDRRKKPSIHSRLITSAIRNRASQMKRVKVDPDSVARASDKSSDGNAVVSVYGKRNLPFLEEPEPTATCSTPNNTVRVKDADDSKPSGSARSEDKGEFSQSSSLGEYSSTTSATDTSNLSSCSARVNRPRLEMDARWVAIQHVLLQYGSLGLENFKLLDELGCGDIAVVYLAELIGSKCLFVLKVINNDMLFRHKKVLRAQTEKEILQMLDHPFLPTLYTHFVTGNRSFLVMEYCPGGDLHKLRQRQQGKIFTEAAARFYVAEVLLALEYLHMVGVVYRDLKPENILVRDDGHIMLSDFDLSMRCTVSPTFMRSTSLGTRDSIKKLLGCYSELSCIDRLCPHPSRGVHVSCFAPHLLAFRKPKHELSVHFEQTEARSYSFVGTHDYIAPEIIRVEGHGSSVDWWTLGIFLYELLYGNTPFKGEGNEETLANIISQNLRFPDDPSTSSHAKELISNLLIKDPEKRLGAVTGAAEIKQHPFFQGLNWALVRCATPPEIPKDFDQGTPVGMHCKKEGNCGMQRADMDFKFF